MSNNIAVIQQRAEKIALVNDGEQQFVLGTTVQDVDTGYIYKYVQVDADSANASSAGRLFYSSADGKNIVTDDYTGGTPAGLTNMPAGIGIGTITKGNFGFLLVDGEYAAILKETGTISVGGILIVGDQDGRVTTKASAGAAITAPTVGVCKVAPASAGVLTVAGFVSLL